MPQRANIDGSRRTIFMGSSLRQEFVSAAGLLVGSLGFLLCILGTFKDDTRAWKGTSGLMMAVVFLAAAAISVGLALHDHPFPWVSFGEMTGMGIVFALATGRAMKSRAENHIGFRWVVSGFWLLFLGTVLDLTDVVGVFGPGIGETAGEITCRLGLGCLGVGFFLWLPTISALDRANAELERHAGELEDEVARRTVELREEVRQRREAEAAALESNASKSRFLANMSHELRTPLNAIIGFSDILRMSEQRPLPAEKVCEYAGDINGAGRHLLDIVNDVLDLAKVESGRMGLAVETVSLRSIIHSATRIVEGKANENGVHLMLDEMPEIVIEADSRAVRQVLLNLMSNAVKFTPQGGSVGVSAELCDGSIHVLVRDTGQGIPAEKIERVFEPFEQVDNTYARAQGGTGLGLALCRRLASLMKGSVTLESELGVGTTARLTLPAGRAISAA